MFHVTSKITLVKFATEIKPFCKDYRNKFLQGNCEII